MDIITKNNINDNYEKNFFIHQNVVPKLNLNVSVLSVDFFVIGCVKLKLNGPIGVYQLTAIPVDDLILLLSKLLSKSTPQTFAESKKIVKSKF